MKKITLIIAGLMLAGSSFAYDCNGKKECSKNEKKESKKECKKDSKSCCKKGAETAKK